MAVLFSKVEVCHLRVLFWFDSHRLGGLFCPVPFRRGFY